MTTKLETIDPFLEDFVPASEVQPPVQEALVDSDVETLQPESQASTLQSEDVALEVSSTKATVSEASSAEAEEELGEPLTILQIQKLEEEVIEALRSIFDPEIPVNIYELGLIYEIKIDEYARTVIQMTLTSPACPVAGTLPGEVEMKALSVDGIRSSRVELVWEPSWTPDMMSESAQLQLGFF